MKDINTKPDVVLGWSSINLTAQVMQKKLIPGKLCQLTDQAAAAVFEKIGQAPIAAMNTYVIVLKAREGTPYLIAKQSPADSKAVTVFAGMHGESQVSRGFQPQAPFYLYFCMAEETKVKAEIRWNIVEALESDTLKTLEKQCYASRDRKHEINVRLMSDDLMDSMEKALKEELKQVDIPVVKFIKEREAAAEPYLLSKIS